MVEWERAKIQGTNGTLVSRETETKNRGCYLKVLWPCTNLQPVLCMYVLSMS